MPHFRVVNQVCWIMKDAEAIRRLLEQVAAGEVDPAEAMNSLRCLPFEDIGFARVDHHRRLRRGFPEVIYARGKTPQQVVDIAQRLYDADGLALATFVDDETHRLLCTQFEVVEYDAAAGVASVGTIPPPSPDTPPLLVVSAGTSDIPVARQASWIARAGACPVEEIFDVGVAGLHRLLDVAERLDAAGAIVVVAGMEGALPSVVAGLVAAPVIAVPTSVGYGASFGGLAALLAMLNSCAGGVAVVNIDNGFGAGLMGAMICHRTRQTLP